MKLPNTYFIFAFVFLANAVVSQTSERLSNQELVVFTKKFIDADKERILGNNQSAFKLYSECLEMDPKNDAVHFQIGRMFLTQNNLEKAAEQFEVASKLDVTNSWYLVKLIEVKGAMGDLKGADKAFKKLRTLEPNNVEYMYNHASLLLHSGKTKKGMSAFDDFEKAAGLSPEVAITKFEFFVGANKYKEAVAVMEKAVADFPDEARFYSYLADLYKAQGDKKKALRVYARALGVEPNNPYIQLSLAEYYEQNAEWDSAGIYLSKAFRNTALDVDTKISILLSKYDKAEHDKEERNKLIELCEALVEVHPQEAKSHSVYGDFLYLDNQLNAARQSYYNTIELDPSKYAIWSQVLLIDSELNDADAMLDDSDKAMELFPSQPAVYLFNGIANNQKENYKAAAKSLKTGSQLAIANYFLSAQILASLGDAYHELGKHTSSDSAYEASLSLDATNHYVLNNYSYFLSLRSENLEKAKTMSFKTVEAQPNNATYLDTYGWVLYQLEEYEEAKHYLQKALDNGGDSSGEVLEHFGDVSFQLGDKAAALIYWQKAREVGGGSKDLDKKLESKTLDE